jgi:hypothetical protein
MRWGSCAKLRQFTKYVLQLGNSCGKSGQPHCLANFVAECELEPDTDRWRCVGWSALSFQSWWADGRPAVIKLLWHVIVGHEWTEERLYLPPSFPNRLLLLCRDDYHERYGFTVFYRSCECGATDEMKLVGDFKAYPASADVKELKRMARL